jgi:hypothetical protein
MKKLIHLFYKLTVKDYENKLKSANNTMRMFNDANGGVGLAYNAQGERIRGYHKPPTKFNQEFHPLVKKYNQ